MFKNYLKIAWRQLMKNRIHSAINLFGLTVGITTLLFIWLYLDFQYNHDQNLQQREQTFRIESDDWHFSTPGPLAPALKASFSEIEYFARVMFWQLTDFTVEGKKHSLSLCLFADREILDIFKLDFIHGSQTTAFAQPNSILLSSKVAEKIFGSINPVGRILTVSDSILLTVSGVYRNLPANLHLKIPALTDFETADKLVPVKEYMGRKTTYNFPAYLRLKKGVSQADFSKKIDKYCKEQFFFSNDNNWYLKNMSEIYFGKLGDWPGIEMVMNFGNYKNMQIFSLVALLVLLIAVVNFINLNTAVALLRSKEVGLRKVFGAKKINVVFQFLTESTLVILLAGLLGWLTALVFLPQFNHQIGTGYERTVLCQPLFAVVYLSLLLFCGMLVGLFSALRLALFSLTGILKRETYRGKSGLFFRRGLIFLQFLVSIILLICALIIHKQLKFMENRDQGFAAKQLMTLSLGNRQQQSLGALIQELGSNPEVAGYSMSRHEINMPETHGSDIAMFKADYIDSGYVKALGLQLIAGRNFISSDTGYVCLVNEKTVKVMRETPQSILGKNAPNLGTVVGVLKDYNYESFHKTIEPIGLIYNADPRYFYWLHIRLKGTTVDGIAQVNRIWQKIFPDQKFSYSLLSDRYTSLYRPQKDFLYLFSIFAGLAVLIACLGIYGLAGFEVNRRTKEIGVRKVLGASAADVLQLMLKEAVLLVVLAGAAATPVANYLMTDWLNSFALRTATGILPFGISILTALLIAVSCVIAVSLKAVYSNPVDSLKYE